MEKITCPNCSHQFHVEGALKKQLEQDYEEKLKTERTQMLKDQQEKVAVLERKEKEFEAKRAKQNEIFQQQLQVKLQEKEGSLKAKINEEYQLKLNTQQKELEEKAAKVKEYQLKEIEYAKLQRQVKEMEQEMELKMQRKLNEEYQTIEEKIVKRVTEEQHLKIKERDKKLEQQAKLIDEMKRKSDQGSMQLQGEVQELAIEATLKQNFPFDEIQEVPKGVRGADTIQIVKNRQFQACGKIVYESKRTKSFVNDWIEKLKIDQRNVKAEIAVIVTQALPKTMKTFGQHQGVWICRFEDFEPLTYVLREILIKTAGAKDSQTNKGDKMELLYSFLTSEEFKLQITGIVEGWQSMKDDLEKEKRSMQGMWKKREKQLEIVIDNAINMYASIKGIAGRALPDIQQLELPEYDPDQDI